MSWAVITLSTSSVRLGNHLLRRPRQLGASGGGGARVVSPGLFQRLPWQGVSWHDVCRTQDRRQGLVPGESWGACRCVTAGIQVGCLLLIWNPVCPSTYQWNKRECYCITVTQDTSVACVQWLSLSPCRVIPGDPSKYRTRGLGGGSWPGWCRGESSAQVLRNRAYIPKWRST